MAGPCDVVWLKVRLVKAIRNATEQPSKLHQAPCAPDKTPTARAPHGFPTRRTVRCHRRHLHDTPTEIHRASAIRAKPAGGQAHLLVLHSRGLRHGGHASCRKLPHPGLPQISDAKHPVCSQLAVRCDSLFPSKRPALLESLMVGQALIRVAVCFANSPLPELSPTPYMITGSSAPFEHLSRPL